MNLHYSNENDHQKALEYDFKALAENSANEQGEVYAGILENLGGDYQFLNKPDSALYFKNRANEYYAKLKNPINIALSQINLASAYVQMNAYQVALGFYRLALPVISENKINEALCATAVGMAWVFENLNLRDSALYYGRYSMNLARQFNFTSRQIDACTFLADLYEKENNKDSALQLLKLTMVLKDSIYNQDRVKDMQGLTLDETIRQQEIASQKKRAEENHIRNLQLLAIGIFIPVFFLIVLFLSRTKVSARVVEFLGILSLLLLFEFITDLIYPYVGNLTNENPIWEMLILVVVAALLEPLNNKMEHWVKSHLVRKSAPAPVPIPILNTQIEED